LIQKRGEAMKVGVIGGGRIGGNVARLLAGAGHEVCLSFSTDPAKLRELAQSIGDRARAGEVRDAVEFGDVVVLSVPWAAVPVALEQAGSLAGKIVIDTTNPFGSAGWEEMPGGVTSAKFNQERMPGARVVKAFNTLTAGFQASAATRLPDRRAVLFMCGDDGGAKATVAGLIEDVGFVPADLGGLADSAPMEAPRRPGALYGDEYRADDARAAVEALRAGSPLPATPTYAD
jgi:8-hydroxy-5-deazaflavin:NADPH oxidoreductase